MNNQGEQRIPCPRCRANNFAGQTNCWQCASSLPPPEATGAYAPVSAYAAQPIPPAASAYPPQNAPVGYAPAASRSSWRLVIPLVLIAVVMLGGLFMFAVRRQRQRASQEERELRQAAQHYRIQEPTLTPLREGTDISNPSALDPGSVDAQAQRALQRGYRQLEERGIVVPRNR